MDADEKIRAGAIGEDHAHRLVDGYVLRAREHHGVALFFQQRLQPQRNVESEGFLLVLEPTILRSVVDTAMTRVDRDDLRSLQTKRDERRFEQWNQAGFEIDRVDEDFSAVAGDGVSQKNSDAIDTRFATVDLELEPTGGIGQRRLCRRLWPRDF